MSKRGVKIKTTETNTQSLQELTPEECNQVGGGAVIAASAIAITIGGIVAGSSVAKSMAAAFFLADVRARLAAESRSVVTQRRGAMTGNHWRLPKPRVVLFAVVFIH